MLQELRNNDLVVKQPWKRSIQRGLCANRDCFEEAKHACSRCGLKYCSDKCQQADWKVRHKHRCEVTNLTRTKIIFNIHKQRIDEFVSGKSSFDRYYSIGISSLYRIQFPLIKSICDPVPYCTLCRDETSGRILTVLEDHECEREPCLSISRGPNLYMVNRTIPAIPLTEEVKQARIQCGLSVRDAVELIPVNHDVQMDFNLKRIVELMECMRIEWYKELQCSLTLIETIICPGSGMGYGNPVLLSLQNVLTYEDYISKTFAIFPMDFPINLFCSILFPNEFKPSMRTGNTDDDAKILDSFLDCEGFRLKNKSEVPSVISTNYGTIFDKDKARIVYREEQEVLRHREGETEDERNERLNRYFSNRISWAYEEFDLSSDCSESLAVCPVDQTCFDDCRNQSIKSSEDVSVDKQNV